MNNMHVFNDVTFHATSKATERMLSIIDSALDDDAQRVAAAVSAAQSIYVSMVKAMVAYGLMSDDVVDESMRFVNEALNKIKEEGCTKLSRGLS